MQENYGDVHLHYNQYPDVPDQYAYSATCKWTSEGRAPYQALEMPVEPPKCHTEFCHPGSWQGKCGEGQRYDRPMGCGHAKMVPPPEVVQAAAQAQVAGVQVAGGVTVDYSTLYLTILAVLALVGFYLLRRRR